jgi:hypothetical protein
MLVERTIGLCASLIFHHRFTAPVRHLETRDASRGTTARERRFEVSALTLGEGWDS